MFTVFLQEEEAQYLAVKFYETDNMHAYYFGTAFSTFK